MPWNVDIVKLLFWSCCILFEYYKCITNTNIAWIQIKFDNILCCGLIIVFGNHFVCAYGGEHSHKLIVNVTI